MNNYIEPNTEIVVIDYDNCKLYRPTGLRGSLPTEYLCPKLSFWIDIPNHYFIRSL